MNFATKDIKAQRNNNTNTNTASTNYSYNYSSGFTTPEYLKLVVNDITNIEDGIITKSTNNNLLYGDVVGNTAIYFYKKNASGWIFKDSLNNNVAAISDTGAFSSSKFNVVDNNNDIITLNAVDGYLNVSDNILNQIPIIQGKINGINEQLLLNPNGGNVTIGSTYNSGYKLEVNGNFKANNLDVDSIQSTNILISNDKGNVNLTADYNDVLAINSSVNIAGDLTVNGSSITNITNTQIINALGYTPYNATNPNTYITANHSGNITATGFIKNGGTSTQFLKANGTVDSNTYVTPTYITTNYTPKLAGYAASVSDIKDFDMTNGGLTANYGFFYGAYNADNKPNTNATWIQGIKFPMANNPEYSQLIVSDGDDVYYGSESGNAWQDWRKIWHSGNSNLSTKDWDVKTINIYDSIRFNSNNTTNYITGDGYGMTFIGTQYVHFAQTQSTYFNSQIIARDGITNDYASNITLHKNINVDGLVEFKNILRSVDTGVLNNNRAYQIRGTGGSDYSSGIAFDTFYKESGESAYSYKERMRIFDNGNVAIGTATNIGYKLYIATNKSTGIYSRVSSPIVSSNSTTYTVGIESNIGQSYNVDSGVTDNGYRLGLNITAYSNISEFKGTIGNQFGMRIQYGAHTSSGTGTINTSTGIKLDFLNTSDTSILNAYSIHSSNGAAKFYHQGNVLLGTTTDTGHKLYVNGSTRLAGTLNVTGAITVSSTTKVNNLNADKVDGYNIWFGDSIQFNSIITKDQYTIYFVS